MSELSTELEAQSSMIFIHVATHTHTFCLHFHCHSYNLLRVYHVCMLLHMRVLSSSVGRGILILSTGVFQVQNSSHLQ